MKRMLVALAIFASAIVAQATTYTYTGQLYGASPKFDYTSCAIGPCADYEGTMRVTGFFTTATPLPANLPGGSLILPFVTSFSFSDGVNTYSSGDPNVEAHMLLAGTDAAGNIAPEGLFFLLELWQSGASPHQVGDRIATVNLTSGSAGLENDFFCAAIGHLPHTGTEYCTTFEFDQSSSALTSEQSGSWTIADSVDFCDAFDYDNANPQTKGWFTDFRRGTQINAQYNANNPANCMLNLTGSVGSAGDMWITRLHYPGNTSIPDPVFNCVDISAQVLIRKSDNRKAVGFVTHFDPTSHTGLFLGLYDNGNSDALTLSTFDGDTGKLTGTVANLFLGSTILENVWYALGLQICNAGGVLSGQASVAVNNVSEVLNLNGAAAPGIAASGQIGIAGYAKSSFVDSSVRNFEWDGI